MHSLALGIFKLRPALAARITRIIFLFTKPIGWWVRPFVFGESIRTGLSPLGVTLPGVPQRKTIPTGYLSTDFRRIPMERARKCLGVSMSAKLLVVLEEAKELRL